MSIEDTFKIIDLECEIRILQTRCSRYANLIERVHIFLLDDDVENAIIDIEEF